MKALPLVIALRRRQVRAFSRLLADYQDHLESAIESELVPGENQPRENRRAIVADLRQDWRAAEDFQILFGNPTGSKSTLRLCAPEEQS